VVIDGWKGHQSTAGGGASPLSPPLLQSIAAVPRRKTVARPAFLPCRLAGTHTSGDNPGPAARRLDFF
jgi:hypothetical protein